MAYIGNTPAENYVSIAAQHFTVSATTSYSLNRSVTNENELALFINNVRQQPGSSYSYTATGTTLTLSVATLATDTMYCVFLGKSVGTIAPPDGSVGTATLATGAVTADKIADGTVVASELANDAVTTDKIANTAVTDAKISAVATSKLTGTVTNAQIADLDAAKLTGTVADARLSTVTSSKLSGALPAVSGASLTGLTAGNITGVIPAANLGTGTANATTFLNGSGAYSEPGGGGLWEYMGTSSFSAVTFVSVTGFTTDYRIEFYNMGFSTSGPQLTMVTTGDNTNFQTSAHYRYSTIMPTGNTSFDNWYQNSVGYMNLTNSGVGNDHASTNGHWEIESVDAASTTQATIWLWRGVFINQSGDNRYVTGGGQRTEYGSSPHNSSGIKITIGSGNMTGNYRKYKRIIA